MVVTVICLLLLAVMSHGQCQDVAPPLEEGCASKDGYSLGLSTCCDNVQVFSTLYQACCTDQAGQCYCNSTLFPMCQGTPPVPPPRQAYCPGPAPAPLVTNRLLNAQAVTTMCDGSGVVGFSINGTPVCNGAFAKNPLTNQSVIYTLTRCWHRLSVNQEPWGSVFGDSIPLNTCSFELVDSPANGQMTTLVLSPLMTYFMEKHVEGCPSPGCVYRTSTMRDAIDLTKCYILSYGLSSLDPASLTNRPAKPTRVDLKVSVVTDCQDTPGYSSQCFRATTNSPACLGDDAAPVYCPLTTGEVVLFGMAAIPLQCDPNAPATYIVIPITL